MFVNNSTTKYSEVPENSCFTKATMSNSDVTDISEPAFSSISETETSLSRLEGHSLNDSVRNPTNSHRRIFDSSLTLRVVFLISILTVLNVGEAASVNGGSSVTSSKCFRNVCRFDEYCDRSTRYCESCAPICNSPDESDKRRCNAMCSGYLKSISEARQQLPSSTPPAGPAPAAALEQHQQQQDESFWSWLGVKIFSPIAIALAASTIIVVALVYRYKARRRRALQRNPAGVSPIYGPTTETKVPIAASPNVYIELPPVHLNHQNTCSMSDTPRFTDGRKELAHPTDDHRQRCESEEPLITSKSMPLGSRAPLCIDPPSLP